MSARQLPLLLTVILGLTAPAVAQSVAAPASPSGPAQGASSPLDLPVVPEPVDPSDLPPDPDPPVTPKPKEPTIYGHSLGQVESIVYVIDTSCSMRGDVQAYVDPVSGQRKEGSRLERAKVEVLKSLRPLPERISFNIVSFDSRIDRWAPRKLHPATSENKASATLWVEALRASGATATGPGVVEGLACCIPEETLVVLITDGIPTAWSPDPEEHRRLIRQHNVANNKIDVIGIAASGRYRAFCRAVANDNLGQYIDVP